MKHAEVNQGVLRGYLDGELDSGQLAAVEQHLKSCNVCSGELATLRHHAARVRDGLDQLSDSPDADNYAIAWSAFQKKRDDWMDSRQNRWTLWQKLSLAGGCVGVAVMVLVLTVAPVRAWAESLLAIFRVERFTVLEINPAALKNNGLQNNQLLNQAIGRVLSDEVTVTQSPQKPRLIADATTVSKVAGFPVQLLPGQTPSSLLLESGAGMNMKLDRDRIQSILDEAGRSDLRIPESVDGAIVGVRVPAGVMAFYGNCGDVASRVMGQAVAGSGTKNPSATKEHSIVVHVGGVDKPVPNAAASANQVSQANTVRTGDKSAQEADATCVSLFELPSPIVSAPQEIDPAQIAQIALQFLGMSANDAASFTQTVDWTSTLVLPVVRGESKYEQVHVNGNEGALLRSANQRQSDHFSLMWVDNGIVFALNGTGDDTTAINLASQLE
jgi:predicted anti-sigma-YlaC factor YlaD